MLLILAGASLLAALAGAVFGPEWIETLTGFEPDGGSGSLERLLLIGPAVAALVLALSGYAARRIDRIFTPLEGTAD